MSTSSVSFRISRHTQDLAETVHALSQRLVSMEQRLEALETHLQALSQQPRQAEQEEAASLAPIEAHIERLLQDCRQLLADQPCGLAGDGLSPQASDSEVDLPLQTLADGPEAAAPQPEATDDGDLDEQMLAELEAA